MNKFKVGDTVRYNATAHEPGKIAGVVGGFGDLLGNNKDQTVTYADGGWDWADKLELLEPEEEAPAVYAVIRLLSDGSFGGNYAIETTSLKQAQEIAGAETKAAEGRGAYGIFKLVQIAEVSVAFKEVA